MQFTALGGSDLGAIQQFMRISILPIAFSIPVLISSCSAFAQELTTDTNYIEDCKDEFANSKLDPIRDKFPIFLNPVTDTMRKNEGKPNRIEKIALRAYLDAMHACSMQFDASQFKNDEKAKLAADTQSKKYTEEKLKPLIAGKITYAEYARRQDKTNKDFEDDLKKRGIDPHPYETQIESWLSPFKSNYPDNSPWWGFYNFAIATAKDVDSGRIAYKEAARLIEDRRVKANQEITASNAPKNVTLNCSVKLNPLLGISDYQDEEVLTIDYANFRVNGLKAEFYENEIRWSQQLTDNSVWYMTLNRLSGYYSEGKNKGSSLWSGHCVPATRQF